MSLGEDHSPRKTQLSLSFHRSRNVGKLPLGHPSGETFIINFRNVNLTTNTRVSNKDALGAMSVKNQLVVDSNQASDAYSL